MATHSSILAWRIPWTKEPGRLCSIGSKRVRHDSGDLAHTPAKYVLRRATNCLPQSSLRKKKKQTRKQYREISDTTREETSRQKLWDQSKEERGIVAAGCAWEGTSVISKQQVSPLEPGLLWISIQAKHGYVHYLGRVLHKLHLLLGDSFLRILILVSYAVLPSLIHSSNTWLSIKCKHRYKHWAHSGE